MWTVALKFDHSGALARAAAARVASSTSNCSALLSYPYSVALACGEPNTAAASCSHAEMHETV